MATAIRERPDVESLQLPKIDDEDRRVGWMSLERYIAFDRAAAARHQLFSGEVIRMAGASFEHNLICANTLRFVLNALEAAGSEALAFGSDQRIRVSDTTILYPDVCILPEDAQIDDKDVLHDPIAIFEVLSASTAPDDLGRKLTAYQTIPSLKHYIVIDQYRISVTHHARTDERDWAIVGQYSQLENALQMTIKGIAITVPLAAIYRRVPIG